MVVEQLHCPVGLLEMIRRAASIAAEAEKVAEHVKEIVNNGAEIIAIAQS